MPREETDLQELILAFLALEKVERMEECIHGRFRGDASQLLLFI
jgi:hypothetical protein